MPFNRNSLAEQAVNPPWVSGECYTENVVRGLLDDLVKQLDAVDDLMGKIKFYAPKGYAIQFENLHIDCPFSRVWALKQLRENAEEWLNATL